MRLLPVAGVVLLFIACTGQPPTSPDTTRSESSRAAASSAPGQPQRPGTRVVEPRSAFGKPIEAGAWGGDHVNLLVTATGGTLEYDCAHGTIDQPFLADSSGRFDLAGTHTREHGGPIRIGEKEDKRPARYTGTTDGRTMTLTVTLAGSNEPLGTFTLTRGQPGRILKCL